MTPLARRVMEKVRQRDHGTYERWFQAIVDATLDEAADYFTQDGKLFPALYLAGLKGQESRE